MVPQRLGIDDRIVYLLGFARPLELASMEKKTIVATSDVWLPRSDSWDMSDAAVSTAKHRHVNRLHSKISKRPELIGMSCGMLATVHATCDP